MPEPTVELSAQLKCKSRTFWYEQSKWFYFRFMSFSRSIQEGNLWKGDLMIFTPITLIS